jgi:hypothetical protein
MRGLGVNAVIELPASPTPGIPRVSVIAQVDVSIAAIESDRPNRISDAVAFAFAQISVCSEISRASSTSMPRYLTVDSSLE